MKRFFLLGLFLFVVSGAWAQGPARPKLVVGIVVDQMRWDYLYRYEAHFGQEGFRRLMRDGFRCEHTMINYLPSFTAPGHTCIYTGSIPAIHGIVSNEWFEQGKERYCTGDSSVLPLGGSMVGGQMSPRNLLTTTVGDELRLATNFRSRVFGISLKDRSSILPAGHTGQAYWFDDSTGNFSSSTYYGNALPEWVRQFNAQRYPDTLLAQDWNLRDAPDSYPQSTADNTRYEGRFGKEAAPVFPHRAQYFEGQGAHKYNTLRKLPAGNRLTVDMAEACIRANRLGQGSQPDMLCVSFSATDYAGHQYGPNALEVEDMYIRLDDELARFLQFLDRQIGKGNYTVFLTADHGGAHNSLFLEDHKIPAGNASELQIRKALNAYLKEKTGKENLVQSLYNYQVFYSPEVLKTFDETARRQLNPLVIAWLQQRPEVAYALDLEQNNQTRLPEPIQTMILNGYYAPRSGSVQMVLKPGWYAGYAPTGTTHGTWNPYDTHIPLLWYGWGIQPGFSYRKMYMTDIAATVSALLRIQMPNGCIGSVIREALK
ncbi:MAG: alkaline phosphatase family protein [Bacteroidetes bacterium]|nr:alkaline phosphatase family protein [Bacteroidota bacterium]